MTNILRYSGMALPAADTVQEIKPTLIMSIWCTCYAIAIILFRCAGRWHRTERVWVEDTIILLSILVVVARMVLANLVLKYGTNNVDINSLQGEDDVRRREIGSQLVLICRLLYSTFLWMVKLSVGIYIARLTDQFWASKSLTSNTSGGRVIKAFLSMHLNRLFYAFLGFSYVAVVMSEALACRPFNHYWLVTPTATSSCRVAAGNLLTMGILDILTDLTLVALPLPMIISAKLPTKIKAEMLLLMLFPLLNVASTCYRLPNIYAYNGSQRYRTLTASIDIFISTASANALVVVSFLQDRGFKKLRYRYQEGDEDRSAVHIMSSGVELDSMDKAKSLYKSGPFNKRTGLLQPPKGTRPPWGSDEDLMRDDSDGGPSTHTTTVRDIENEGSDTTGQGTIKLVDSDTCHLSPGQKVETTIAASRPMEFDDRMEDTLRLTRPPPICRSLRQGIVVETSWKADVS